MSKLLLHSRQSCSRCCALGGKPPQAPSRVPVSAHVRQHPTHVVSHPLCCSAVSGAAAGSAGAPSTSGGTSTGSSSPVNRSDPAPYKWSWQQEGEAERAAQYRPLELDAAEVAAAASIADLTSRLQSAAAPAATQPATTPTLTPASSALLDDAVQRLLSASAACCTTGQAAQLLDVYGRLTQGGGTAAAGPGPAATAAPPLVASVLSYLVGSDVSGGGSGNGALAAASARELAELLWALSEVQEDLPWDAPPAAARRASSGPESAAAAGRAPGALQAALLARVREQDFLGPDLCRAVCGLGSLASSSASSASSAASASPSSASIPSAAAPAAPPASAPPAASSSESSSETAAPPSSASRGFPRDPVLAAALAEEIKFQLTEFGGDFDAQDLARLMSGMAGLGLGGAVAGDEEFRRVLLKAVYGKTRSLVDKAAVDFALGRLLDADPAARSMHYDTRWTHEELRWLPRRERDKRRILNEGWYRTRWGGWAPGGEQ